MTEHRIKAVGTVATANYGRVMVKICLPDAAIKIPEAISKYARLSPWGGTENNDLYTQFSRRKREYRNYGMPAVLLNGDLPPFLLQ